MPSSRDLPVSGPLSMSMIQGEFGGANPISLSEYYGADDGIPVSGTISISDFYGASDVGEVVATVLIGFEQDIFSDMWGFGGEYSNSDHGAITPTTITMSGRSVDFAIARYHETRSDGDDHFSIAVVQQKQDDLLQTDLFEVVCNGAVIAASAADFGKNDDIGDNREMFTWTWTEGGDFDLPSEFFWKDLGVGVDVNITLRGNVAP